MKEIRFGDKAVDVLPPHGKVELVDAMADDLDVVNAARVSFNKESDTLDESGEKLVAYLLRNSHGTPFEHNLFKFRVRAPIFVFREWHRHRIGISINEESGRYVELDTDFWLPDDDAVRVQTGKPGHYRYESVGSDLAPYDGDHLESVMTHGENVRDQMEGVYRYAEGVYHDLLKDGYAKEIARAVLPVGLFSTMIWSANARSLMAFFTLRSAPDAQREIRLYSHAMERLFAEVMPVTYDAFCEARGFGLETEDE